MKFEKLLKVPDTTAHPYIKHGEGLKAGETLGYIFRLKYVNLLDLFDLAVHIGLQYFLKTVSIGFWRKEIVLFEGI